MDLEVKRPEHIVPSYSLTGDLLSYLRCRLNYRFHNGSALPPSRPVQLWFGEFLHGTLEMSYRFWNDLRQRGKHPPDFPWPCTERKWHKPPPAWAKHDIGRFADSVEEALRRQGKEARSRAVRDSAYKRIKLAVNELGPHLFPLIASAERRVIGTRPVPSSQIRLRCENYEVHGVIDVLTNLTLQAGPSDNPFSSLVREACPALSGTFEVIVDYKGTRRPHTTEDFWEQGDWQIQTYAWLRQRQPDALPVAAGVLIYINELLPDIAEMEALKRGLQNGSTDVKPETKSMDEQIIRMWRPGMDTGQLSLTFRLRRAIRVLPISRQSVEAALAGFDDVVRRAEEDVVAEASGRDILNAWPPTCQDEATCVACDFRPFCPQPAGAHKNYQIRAPTAP